MGLHWKVSCGDRVMNKTGTTPCPCVTHILSIKSDTPRFWVWSGLGLFAAPDPVSCT